MYIYLHILHRSNFAQQCRKCTGDKGGGIECPFNLENGVYLFVDLGSNAVIIETQSNTLQHTATYCNTLQHTATHCNTLFATVHLSDNKNTEQHTATYCNTLQHTATACNTLFGTVHLDLR